MQKNFKILEHNFKNLIMEQCKFYQFDKYLEAHPDFELPKITPELLGWENTKHITIPGLFGGFNYFLEEIDDTPILYCEQSSRMDHSSDDYSYYEVTENGSRILKSKERATIQKKFQAASEKDFKQYSQKLKELKK